MPTNECNPNLVENLLKKLAISNNFQFKVSCKRYSKNQVSKSIGRTPSCGKHIVFVTNWKHFQLDNPKQTPKLKQTEKLLQKNMGMTQDKPTHLNYSDIKEK